MSELFGLLKAICAAIGSILAFEIQVSATLTRRVSITFYLAALAFIAIERLVSKSLNAIELWTIFCAFLQ